MDDAIDANAVIALDIHRYLEITALCNTDYVDYKLNEESTEAATSQALQRVSISIRQLYRDWSAEGAVERRLCYDPVLDELEGRFGPRADLHNLKVLVPGSGLGRLAYELALRGYHVDANEISIHQLITSDFILNFPSPHLQDLPEQYELYPFAHSFANQLSVEHQLKKVMVPDVQPAASLRAQMPGSEQLASDHIQSHGISLIFGDFTHIYQHEKHKGAFDIVATVFFIDTATNLLRYVDTIHHCLKAGGIWINLGPLLWHSSLKSQQESESEVEQDTGLKRDSGGVELTHEEVISVVKATGFVVEKEEIRKEPVGYIQNTESMLQSLYRVATWVARKMV